MVSYVSQFTSARATTRILKKLAGRSRACKRRNQPSLQQRPTAENRAREDESTRTQHCFLRPKPKPHHAAAKHPLENRVRLRSPDSSGACRISRMATAVVQSRSTGEAWLLPI